MLVTTNLVTGFTSSVDGSASYTYDPTNQLTAATYTGTNQPANESYSFDSTGNRTNTGYTTGTNNQLTSDGTFNYTYDHEGNRATRTRISSGSANDYLTTYTWDYRNRLTDVDYYNNSSVLTKHIHYVYDVYDHLIGTEVDATGSGSYGSSEWYALDLPADPNAPAQPVLQFDGNGNETYRFLSGPSAAGLYGVLAQEAITTQGSSGTTTYPLPDGMGSARDVVDTSSSVVDHIVYNSFGQVAYESNAAIAHWAGFAGYHTDASTGLDYADFRWYDPLVGRWISEDPLGFGGGDTNVSRYVGNAVTGGIDPTGEGILSWVYTGYWSPPADMLQAAMDAAGSYYTSNAGNAHHALDAVSTVPVVGLLATGASGALTALEGEAHNAVMANGLQINGPLAGVPVFGNMLGQNGPPQPIGGPHPPAAAFAQQFTQFMINYGQMMTMVASLADQWMLNVAIVCGQAACFVAGTQVVVPGQVTEAAARTTTADASLSAGANVVPSGRWMVFIALGGLGLAGCRAAGARKRRDEEEAAQRATEQLFRALEDDDMLDNMASGGRKPPGNCLDWPMDDEAVIPDETIDELCEALFHANVAPVSKVPYPVGWAPPTYGPARAPANDVVTTVPRTRGGQCPPYALAPSRARAGSGPAQPRRRKRVGLIWLAACLLLGGWLGFGGPTNSPTERSESTQFEELSFVRDVAASQAPRTVNIEDIRVGQRVVGTNPDRATDTDTTDTQVDPRTWNLVRLRGEARWEDGTLDTIEVETLQPRDWVRRFAPRVGVSAPIPLDLIDMGLPAELRATVVAIEPCPEIEPAPGHVVLTTVNHLNSFLLELTFADAQGGERTVKPTGFHKFYSETHRDWVSASELRKGESLKGLQGSHSVVAVERVPGVHRVYNMTVEGEHVYRVSPLGVLVHNECDPGFGGGGGGGGEGGGGGGNGFGGNGFGGNGFGGNGGGGNGGGGGVPPPPGGTPMPPAGGGFQQPNILGAGQWIRWNQGGGLNMGGPPLPGFDGPIDPLPPGPMPPPSPN